HHDRGDVRQDGVAADRGVRHAERPRRAGTRRGDRRKAEMLQVARGADVPWIWNDEASALVERTERAALRGDSGHSSVLSSRALSTSPSGEVGETRKRRAGWGV